MPGAKVLNLIGLVLMAAGVLCDFLVPRLAVPRPEALNVQAFPRKIADWQAGPDRKVDPELADRLTTATIVERDYRNLAGKDIDLLLVTADRDQDIHDPGLCLPAQGWEMGKPQVLRYGAQRVNSVDIQQDGARYLVLYWMAGYQAPVRPQSRFLVPFVRLRSRLVGYHEGASLLVRLVAREEDRATLDKFAAEVMPDIAALRRQAKIVSG